MDCGARRCWSRAIVAAASIVVVACTQSTGDIFPSDGYVYGVVRNAAGAAPGAQVEAQFFRFPCSQPPATPSRVTGTTAADGRYRLLLRGPHFTEWVVCVVVRAETVTGEMGASPGVSLVLRAEHVGRPDSVRVDVTLQ